MTWRDTFDFEILGGVACQFENFGSEVFEHGREVDGCLAADARLLAGYGTEVTLYATAGELGAESYVSALIWLCCCRVGGYEG